MAAALILIWGKVFYRLYKNIKTSTEISQPKIETFEAVEEINLFDTFKIAANYPDPFLGQIKIPKPVNTNTGNVPKLSTPIIKVAAPSIQWPNVSYKGFINDQTTGKKMALLYINDKSNKIYLGSKIGEISISKIYRDSVELKLGKEIKVFRK